MSGMIVKKLSRDSRKPSVKRTAMRDEQRKIDRLITDVDSNRLNKMSQSSTSSPFINKVMTPNLKSFKARSPYKNILVGSPETDKNIRKFETGATVNTYQQRLANMGMMYSESNLITRGVLVQSKRGRSSHKEASLKGKTKDVKQKKSPSIKKTLKTEFISGKMSNNRISNKENVPPNLQSSSEAQIKRLQNKTVLQDQPESTSYQMFSKFLKTLELRPDNTDKVKQLSKQNIDRPMKRDKCLSISESGVNLLLASAGLIAQIKTAFEIEEDTYDLVREYVDHAQNPEFKNLNFSLTSSNDSLVYKIVSSIKLERWSIMMLFYYRFSTKLTQIRMKHLLRDLIDETLENAVCLIFCIKVISTNGKRLETAKRSLLRNLTGIKPDQLSDSEKELLLQSNGKKIQEKLLNGYSFL